MIKSNYTFGEIIELQRLPLSDKVTFSIEVLQQCEKITSHNVALAFSGGKDSLVVADLVERFVPTLHGKILCIFGNTGVEFPESLAIARKYGKAHYGDRFIETELLRLDHDELRYDFARELIERLESEGALDEVLKADGKL